MLHLKVIEVLHGGLDTSVVINFGESVDWFLEVVFGSFEGFVSKTLLFQALDPPMQVIRESKAPVTLYLLVLLFGCF